MDDGRRGLYGARGAAWSVQVLIPFTAILVTGFWDIQIAQLVVVRSQNSAALALLINEVGNFTT